MALGTEADIVGVAISLTLTTRRAKACRVVLVLAHTLGVSAARRRPSASRRDDDRKPTGYHREEHYPPHSFAFRSPGVDTIGCYHRLSEMDK